MKNKKVLFISRHNLDDKAKEALERKIGKFDLSRKDFLLNSDSKKAFDEFIGLARIYKADLVGIVPPAQLTAEIIRRLQDKEKFNIDLFFIISKPVQGEEGKLRKFEFDHLEFVKI